jgi:leucyl aminopeptidase (aminopeptidase T)
MAVPFDEKICGTAYGNRFGLPGYRSKNKSSVHWMICDMRTDSTIHVDGTVHKNGAFVSQNSFTPESFPIQRE